MEVNYEENNLVNLSNSILKYFGIKPFHNTLDVLDKELEENKYKNVVLYVCDGLGYYNLKKVLKSNSFLKQKNQNRKISSVFPPTTTAATTTLLSGLTPSEHHWFGWDMYFKDTDETTSLFLNLIKDSSTKSKLNVLDREYMNYKNIVDLINENTNNLAYFAYPFSKDNKCLNIDDVNNRIKELTKKEGKKFIYAYIENPDKLMHKYGIFSQEVKKEIYNINEKIEKLSQELHDTLIIVTADHGLIPTKSIILSRDLKEMYDMLERTTSIEPRCVGIKLKKEIQKEEFINLYKKELLNDFKLLTVEKAIESHLFGLKDSIYLRDTIGDYLLIATNNIALFYDEKAPKFKANHAGLSKEELEVPLIMIDCKL
ncbi:MAG: alkaline phosphatase family protein [Bacilli bacterium]|nr:alkaline phosphatase family protein [Bacilli bacterium]